MLQVRQPGECGGDACPPAHLQLPGLRQRWSAPDARYSLLRLDYGHRAPGLLSVGPKVGIFSTCM